MKAKKQTSTSVLAGTLSKSNKMKDMKGQRRNSIKYIKHEHFDKDSPYLTEDIALIKVNKNFDFKYKYVKKIELDMGPVSTADAFVAGWGFTNKEKTKHSDKLLAIATKVITNDDCKARVKPYESYILSDKLCILNPVNKGVCPGDSGGGNLLINRLYKDILFFLV